MKLGMAERGVPDSGAAGIARGDEPPGGDGRGPGRAASRAFDARRPQIALEAARVRQALEALEARDDNKALGLCGTSPAARRSASGNSSSGDWPLSIAERAEAQANWDRLEFGARVPFRIVKRLRNLEAGKPTAAGPGANIAALESMVFGESILPRLSELNTLLSKQQWPEILRRIPALRASLLRVDPRLAAHLTGALIGPLVLEAAERDYDSGRRLILDFIRVSEPMPIDPSWNRLWGLV